MGKRRHPSILNAYEYVGIKQDCMTEVNGRWVPARSEGYASFLHRVKAAWMVFQGRADALHWPGQDGS